MGKRGSSRWGDNDARPTHATATEGPSIGETCLSVRNYHKPGDTRPSQSGEDHEIVPQISCEERNEEIYSFRANNDRLGDALKCMKISVKQVE